HAIEAVTHLHGPDCDLNHPGHPSATVALLRLTSTSAEYLVLADSTIVLETAGGTEAITDSRIDRMATKQHDRMHSLATGAPDRPSRGPGRRTLPAKQPPRRRDGGAHSSVMPRPVTTLVVGEVTDRFAVQPPQGRPPCRSGGWRALVWRRRLGDLAPSRRRV